MGDDGPRWILVICMLAMAGGGWRRSRSARAVGYLVWSRGTNPWFRRRLWPDLARGEVIAPGRKVAA